MTRQRYVRAASAAAAIGGAAWVTKVAVLATADGEDGLATAVLFIGGIGLMLLGSTWIGVRAAGSRPLAIAVALAAVCPLLVLASFAALDPLGKAVVGSGWFEDEVAVLATGVLWLAASLPAWLATTTASARPSAPSTT